VVEAFELKANVSSADAAGVRETKHQQAEPSWKQPFATTMSLIGTHQLQAES
jgi:hypothetical protein